MRPIGNLFKDLSSPREESVAIFKNEEESGTDHKET
jgi:hypothetical protein